MTHFFKTIDGHLTEIDHIEDYAWIVMSNPNAVEKQKIMDALDIEPSFFNAALDEEEAAHIEVESGQTAIILDIPYKTKDAEYYTIPMGFILAGKNLITISINSSPIIESFTSGQIKNIDTHLRTRLVFQIFYRVAQTYLLYIKQINKITNAAEQALHKSMKNQELIRLMDIEKSFVYFSTSLKSYEVNLQRISRGKLFKLYDEDRDLLEDVLVEVNQATEMCTIYRDILSGTMDAFASIISNNLNIVMKVLTSITILMAIPNMITSFYGMNVGLPFQETALLPTLLSIAAVVVVAVILKKKNMM